MLDLILYGRMIFDLVIVLAVIAVAVMLLWTVDHSQRTRFSADRRGQRHGRKNKF
jgi:hypothetical protein